MRTARQGTFDGLCGVYAIMNSLDLAGAPARRSAFHKDMFVQLTHALGDAALLSAMNDGLEAGDLLRAAKTAFEWLAREYAVELTIRQPFRDLAFRSAKSFVDAIRTEATLPNTAVIIQVQMPGLSHWTVARRFTGQRLLLRDSAGLGALNISSFSLDKGPYRLLTSDTLVMQRFC